MTRPMDFQTLLYRAQLQLEEGQSDRALFAIKTIPVADEQQQREVDYLLGWYFVQQKKWNDAIGVLSPLCKPEDLEEKGDSANSIEQEHRAISFLRLGQAAVNLAHFDDAFRHFADCLKALQKRRTPLPSVEIKARYSLGLTCNMRGLHSVAIDHYREVLSLCLAQGDNINKLDLANIYYGLADAYRLNGDIMEAYIAGKNALKLYEEMREQSLEARIHNVLGRISFLLGYHEEASDHYLQAIAIAGNLQKLGQVMINCAALADLRLSQGRLDEAKRYCELSREHIDTLKDKYMCGVTYSISGKVTGAMARKAAGEQRQQLFTAALSWFEKAEQQLSQIQTHVATAEMYGWWAEVLEEAGKTQDALARWKQSCKALNGDQTLD